MASLLEWTSKLESAFKFSINSFRENFLISLLNSIDPQVVQNGFVHQLLAFAVFKIVERDAVI